MANYIARYLPNDKTFAAKNIEETNLRLLLRGMACEFIKADEQLKLYSDEVIPDATIKLLAEWEQAVGIPDECFSGTGGLDERRNDVLVKLVALGAQTANDFESIGAAFGVTVTATPGLDSGETFTGGDSEARHTLVLDVAAEGSGGFPYPFPLPFVSSTINLLECLFNKIKPATCNILIREVP